jgi:hypothetical protein
MFSSLSFAAALNPGLSQGKPQRVSRNGQTLIRFAGDAPTIQRYSNPFSFYFQDALMTLAGIFKTPCALAVTAAMLLGAAGCAQTTTATPSAAASASAGKTEVLWLGQASFRIKSPGGKTIVVDPWLTGGTKTPAPYKTDIAALGKVDLLLVTHAHVDHMGDAPALAKLHSTKLYGPADMITPMVTLGILPAGLASR